MFFKSTLLFVGLLNLVGTLGRPVDQAPRSADVDLAGLGLDLKRSEQPRGVDLDLAGVGLDLKRSEQPRSADVDLAGLGLDLKRSEQADGLLGSLNPLVSKLGLSNADVLKSVGDALSNLGLKEVGCTVSDTDISVAAADPSSGVAMVTVSGACLLKGASVTLPILTA